jgi:hypothetical protein
MLHIALALLVAFAVQTQDQPGAQPQPKPETQPEAQPAAPAAESPLRGPQVRDNTPARPTIVARDFEGGVKHPESTPEEAAAEAMALSEEERTKVRAIFTRRAKVLEDVIADNIPLLTKLDTAGKTGDKGDLAVLLFTLYQKTEKLREHGPLDAQVRRELSKPNAREFDRLLDEYWDAVWASKRGKLNKDGQKYNRIGAVAETKFESLGREAERAFKRLEGSGELAYRYLFKGIELTDDQRVKVREILQRHTEMTKGAPTEAQNRAVFVMVMQVLEPAQQRQLVKNVKGLTGE